jgi:hypothetical protein
MADCVQSLKSIPYGRRGDSHFGMISSSQEIVCPAHVGVVRTAGSDLRCFSTVALDI